MWCSFVNHVWWAMVGTANAINLLNSTNVKLFTILNNLGVFSDNLTSSSQTFTIRSTIWHMPSSNSWALNMSNELTTIFTIVKTYYFHLSIHVCKLFLYHVTWGWGVITIFCKVRTIAWRQSRDFQVTKPFHLSEKWQKSKSKMLPLINFLPIRQSGPFCMRLKIKILDCIFGFGV